MKNRDLTTPAGILIGIAFMLAITALWLLAVKPASGHEPLIDVDTSSDCGTYTVRIDLIADLDDPQDHRVFVTLDEVVIDKRDTIGLDDDLLNYLVLGGSKPVDAYFEVWVFDSEFIFDNDVGTAFGPSIGIGDAGLHAYESAVVRGENTCPEATPEPTDTPVVVTATPEPTSTPEPTATQVTLTTVTCEGDAQVTRVDGEITSFVSPHASCVTPTAQPPAGPVGSITPPSTGSGGLK